MCIHCSSEVLLLSDPTPSSHLRMGNITGPCHNNENITFFYNKSGKSINTDWQNRDYVIVTLGMIVSFIVIFSNFLVIGAIFKNRRFHFPIYYLLGNMALADLFAGVAYFYMMLHTGPWTKKLSLNQWFARQGLINTSLTASVLSLLFVAVERHQTIFNVQLHSSMSTRRVFIVMLLIWLVAVIMGLVPQMGWNCTCELDECSTMAPLYHRSFLIFWAVLNLLTFSIMVAVYTRIFLYVRHKGRQMSQHTSSARQRETMMSLMKTVTMILGCFVVCWTPALVVLLLDGLNCDKEIVLGLEKYCLVLAECNSFVNPIIYCFRDKDMRRTFKEILHCMWRRNRKHVGLSEVHFHTVEHEVLSESNGIDDNNHNRSTRSKDCL